MWIRQQLDLGSFAQRRRRSSQMERLHALAQRTGKHRERVQHERNTDRFGHLPGQQQAACQVVAGKCALALGACAVSEVRKGKRGSTDITTSLENRQRQFRALSRLLEVRFVLLQTAQRQQHQRARTWFTGLLAEASALLQKSTRLSRITFI